MGIREVMGRGGRKSNGVIENVVVDGVEKTDRHDLVIVFNNHFATVAYNLERQLSVPDGVSSLTFTPSRLNSFVLLLVTPAECKNLILKLKNCSYGRDAVSARLLKSVSHYVSQTLSFLIKESFRLG